jgi:aryl-alcohol dehydrogenase-like predicted oxidoreductase
MNAIPLRPFGATGDSWPALAMGGGFPGFAGFDRSIETVRRAFALGVRYFDTSVLYRAGASQAILGEALAGQTERHFLATKVGYFREARHFRSVEALHVQLGESLRLLRRDSVDLLQIHEADWDNWWTDRPDVGHCELFDLEGSFDFANAPVIQFLREAKARGLCRRIGITGNNARHLARLIRELDGLDSVLVAYNYTPLNVTARETVIPAAAARGLAVIVAGLFTFVYSIPAGWRTEGTYFGRHADRQLARLQQLQRECGLPMAELAVRFVAPDERISAVLVGACHPPEIEQNIASFSRGPLPADLHAAMEAIAADF